MEQPTGTARFDPSLAFPIAPIFWESDWLESASDDGWSADPQRLAADRSRVLAELARRRLIAKRYHHLQFIDPVGLSNSAYGEDHAAFSEIRFAYLSQLAQFAPCRCAISFGEWKSRASGSNQRMPVSARESARANANNGICSS